MVYRHLRISTRYAFVQAIGSSCTNSRFSGSGRFVDRCATREREAMSPLGLMLLPVNVMMVAVGTVSDRLSPSTRSVSSAEVSARSIVALLMAEPRGILSCTTIGAPSRRYEKTALRCSSTSNDQDAADA